LPAAINGSIAVRAMRRSVSSSKRPRGVVANGVMKELRRVNRS
jgi:hypothetical protein